MRLTLLRTKWTYTYHYDVIRFGSTRCADRNAESRKCLELTLAFVPCDKFAVI